MSTKGLNREICMPRESTTYSLAADVLALKFAGGFFGADQAVATALGAALPDMVR